jgi:hypothetical protein
MYVLERLRREAFRNGEVNVPVAKALLYGLQTASYNLRHTNFEPVIADIVTCDATSLDKDLDGDLDKLSATPSECPLCLRGGYRS